MPDEPSLPPMTTIGFMPRLRLVVEESWHKWISKPEVSEICSMSTCNFASHQRGGSQRWLHNDLGLYDSKALAWPVCPQEGDYEMFAYSVVPVLFGEGATQPLDVQAGSEAVPPDYRLLGYDVVCWGHRLAVSVLLAFGCSPLSCNGMATRVKVNAFCLVDELDQAMHLPQLFYRRHCRTQTVISQVWRKATSCRPQAGTT